MITQSSFVAPLHIGPLTVDPPVVLAPMAGITDAPFRLLCAEHGGGLYVSEMVTARGLLHRNERTERMVDFHPDEPVRSLQLYGSDPEVVGAVVRRLVDEDRVDHLDLNMGCPVPKVTRTGGGAALPVNRPLFAAVVRAAVAAAGAVPVTVKMRMGLDDDRLTYLDAGRIAADEGAAAVALHARTVSQGYSGTAAWEAIARLRGALPAEVPVLGNGDIWAAQDALDMVERTGCDGVVVGRGCLGRPWLFGDLSRAFAGLDPLGPPRFAAIAATARRHLALARAWNGDDDELLWPFRKHLGWYLKGYRTGSELRARAHQITSVADVEAILDAVDPDATVEPNSIRAVRGKNARNGRVVLPEGWWEQRDAEVTVTDDLAAVSGG